MKVYLKNLGFYSMGKDGHFRRIDNPVKPLTALQLPPDGDLLPAMRETLDDPLT